MSPQRHSGSVFLATTKQKKTDAVEHLEVFHRVGLLFNVPSDMMPGCTLCSLPKVSTTCSGKHTLSTPMVIPIADAECNSLVVLIQRFVTVRDLCRFSSPVEHRVCHVGL